MIWIFSNPATAELKESGNDIMMLLEAAGFQNHFKHPTKKIMSI